MANLNFVPDDYVQNNESQRTNVMYLVLLLIVMLGIGGAFMTIKYQQKKIEKKEHAVNQKMSETNESIQKFEKLQAKRKEMMKTALMTTELLEPIQNSVLLASLTNDLPAGVSLSSLRLIQKDTSPPTAAAKPSSKYKNMQNKLKGPDASVSAKVVSPEQFVETQIDIEGLAPTDSQVAEFIERLNSSKLFESVVFVESKEYTVRELSSAYPEGLNKVFRSFKLTTLLNKNLQLTEKDIDQIRAAREKTAYDFNVK